MVKGRRRRDNDSDGMVVVPHLPHHQHCHCCRERATGGIEVATGVELTMAMTTWWLSCYVFHVVIAVIVSRTDEVGCGANERGGERRVVDERSDNGRRVDDDDDVVVDVLPCLPHRRRCRVVNGRGGQNDEVVKATARMRTTWWLWCVVVTNGRGRR